MKMILHALALAALLVVAPNWSYALESIEIVTLERAKALGLEIRSNAAGPDAVRIELEFAIQGELKDYHRVALEMHNGGKLLATSTLMHEESKPGRVVVSLTADRAKLDQFTLKVVTQSGPRARTGHVIQVKDFVENAAKVDKDKAIGKKVKGAGEPGPAKKRWTATGKIVELDPMNPSLATLSIGSDAGLAIGTTLKVFRFKPDALYIGTIRIVAVSPQKSVGRLQGSGGNPNAPVLRVGDLVGSDLTKRNEAHQPAAREGSGEKQGEKQAIDVPKDE